MSRDCTQCPEMVSIPLGSFVIGMAPGQEANMNFNEEWRKRHLPQQRIRISKAFSMGKYEVTRGEYAAFVQATGRSDSRSCWQFDDGGMKPNVPGNWQRPGFSQADDHPVVCILG